MKKRFVLSAAIAAFCVASAHAVDYTSASYVQDGLIAQWDAIDNEGTGTHNPKRPSGRTSPDTTT